MTLDGMTNSQSGGKTQAEEGFTAAIQALNIDPQLIDKMVGLADALLEKNLYLEAERMYRVAMALDPRIVGVAWALRRIDELKRNRNYPR
jgi:Tfp pilus assembly protein PilF